MLLAGPGRTFGPAPLLVATAVAAVPFYLQPFAVVGAHQPMALFPFLGYYAFTTLQTLSHVIDLLLIYAPIGFAIQWARKSSNESARAVIWAVVIALPLEYGQGWIAGRFPDITDVGMAGLGALIGAVISRRGMQSSHFPRQQAD